MAPETCLRQGLGYPVHVEIVICHCSYAALDHLHSGQQGAKVDIIGSEIGLHGPDVTVKPFLHGNVFGGTPEEHHSRMGVVIYQPWNGQATLSLDNPSRHCTFRARGHHTGYLVTLYGDVAVSQKAQPRRIWIKGRNVPYKDVGHRPSPQLDAC